MWKNNRNLIEDLMEKHTGKRGGTLRISQGRLCPADEKPQRKLRGNRRRCAGNSDKHRINFQIAGGKNGQRNEQARSLSSRRWLSGPDGADAGNAETDGRSSGTD